MKVQERKQEHVDSMITEHVIFVISQVGFGQLWQSRTFRAVQVENTLAASRSIASRSTSSTVSSIETANVGSSGPFLHLGSD